MESSVLHITKLREEPKKCVIMKDGSKRSADHLPEAGDKKRILGDITNKGTSTISKAKPSNKKAGKCGKIDSQYSNTSSCKSEKSSVTKDASPEVELPVTKIEDGDDSSIFVSALECLPNESSIEKESEVSVCETLPPGVEDFDKSCLTDPYSEPRYAADIFKYYREREKMFPVTKYLDKQAELSKAMRAILIDWMVEVQESFELNHETLYLAVKLVDRYLMSQTVPKIQLQLVGATAIFVAAKLDERQPPLVDDYLYICDDCYNREQLIQTEIKILKTVNFDLGIPLSYRFLRRFARCGRIGMELLTLARYILETSLMDYDLIDVLDSKMAAASLFLALKMKGEKWTPTLQYYSGYQENELSDLVISLNKNISAVPNKQLQTIRKKYSHEIFFKVAKVPTLNLKQLRREDQET
ncbi:G2/mitotic-specific cyclin-B3-like [Stegodyphus dumicola]|uniref:G2/mitotic-specific cyclin-B3-like n=1 Tax=Stegodyphus dumicola TaxID=202533 RepID=UPI0015AD9FCA|nr:G2/mitotic-specific cyclin-B3-like [Stegodyphus dumicola]XP_035206077.1 G2/mitotic-specific cyclin-B3-like [Stegodyphus dumicola]XP_035206078.1 G2/mitotic-specific cyclin-B3-like [Stegodyphus dumicola]XP_035206079.1 G2/mitotic-specific cyclin-B3-like [Stegodyphus dumicola]XP_035206080.1 G2/mitotic-specific cyclin-B3-like [Stegodyphus dumicola]